MENRQAVRKSSGVKSEALDGRALWLRYRNLLLAVVLGGSGLGIFEVIRLLFFR